MDLLLFSLVTLGFTLIVTQSSLFRPFREAAQSVHEKVGDLISCPMCLGFWAGFVGAAAFGLEIQSRILSGLPPVGGYPIFAYMAHGMISSWVCWTAHVIQVRLGQTRMLRHEQVAPETYRIILDGDHVILTASPKSDEREAA